jgi:hypothetical protein
MMVGLREGLFPVDSRSLSPGAVVMKRADDDDDSIA